MLSTMPPKPVKERATKAAATSVIGKPSKHLGGLAWSTLLLTPVKITIASIKPTPAPREPIKLSTKL